MKGGTEILNSIERGGTKINDSLFKKTIENQFDYICKRVVEDERKNYFLQYYKRLEKEICFSAVEEYQINQIGVLDKYEIDYEVLMIDDLIFLIEDEYLYDALKKLDLKKRKILLLHYYLDMSDIEIGEILCLSRSTVYRHRKNSLTFVRKYMEVKKNEI